MRSEEKHDMSTRLGSSILKRHITEFHLAVAQMNFSADPSRPHARTLGGYCRATGGRTGSAPIKAAFTNMITDADSFRSFRQLSFLLSALKKSVSWCLHPGFGIYLTVSPWRLRGMTPFHLSLRVWTSVNTLIWRCRYVEVVIEIY